MLSELLFTCSKELFGGIFWRKKYEFNNSFWTLGEIFSEFVPKILDFGPEIFDRANCLLLDFGM